MEGYTHCQQLHFSIKSPSLQDTPWLSSIFVWESIYIHIYIFCGVCVSVCIYIDIWIYLMLPHLNSRWSLFNHSAYVKIMAATQRRPFLLFTFYCCNLATLLSLSLSSPTSSLYFSFLFFFYTHRNTTATSIPTCILKMLLKDNISFSSLIGKYENQQLHLHRAICILSLSCGLPNEKFISLKGISYTSNQLLQGIGYISSNPV